MNDCIGEKNMFTPSNESASLCDYAWLSKEQQLKRHRTDSEACKPICYPQYAPRSKRTMVNLGALMNNSKYGTSDPSCVSKTSLKDAFEELFIDLDDSCLPFAPDLAHTGECEDIPCVAPSQSFLYSLENNPVLHDSMLSFFGSANPRSEGVAAPLPAATPPTRAIETKSFHLARTPTLNKPTRSLSRCKSSGANMLRRSPSEAGLLPTTANKFIGEGTNMTQLKPVLLEFGDDELPALPILAPQGKTNSSHAPSPLEKPRCMRAAANAA